ncbi:MAG: HAD family phosphatase [Actinobacteria bacterium]|nr:HAD family phosphatase [Actinomycetota bacterium]
MKKTFKLFQDYKQEIKAGLKNKLKVIYTDLDGTLLNDRGCLIKDEKGGFFFESVELLKKASQKNWDIVLVSGRSRLQLRYNAMLMGLHNYISELGCEIVYGLGREVHETFDSKNFNYEITRGGKDLVSIIGLLKGAFPNKIEGNIEWSMGRNYNALFVGDIDLEIANRLLLQNGYAGLSLVDNGFSKMFDTGLDVEHARIFNLMPKGVDKSSGIRVDKKIRNLKSFNCIALGDSIEDIKMAKEVEYFFLMRDAVEKSAEFIEAILQYKNIYVTGKKMNRGWVEVIKYLAD